MSGRLHAVANAIADRDGWTSYSRAQKAIDAADELMFSEAAIERAAKAIFDIRDDPYDMDEWEDLDSTDREIYLCQARAVVAALREET